MNSLHISAGLHTLPGLYCGLFLSVSSILYYSGHFLLILFWFSVTPCHCPSPSLPCLHSLFSLAKSIDLIFQHRGPSWCPTLLPYCLHPSLLALCISNKTFFFFFPFEKGHNCFFALGSLCLSHSVSSHSTHLVQSCMRACPADIPESRIWPALPWDVLPCKTSVGFSPTLLVQHWSGTTSLMSLCLFWVYVERSFSVLT